MFFHWQTGARRRPAVGLPVPFAIRVLPGVNHALLGGRHARGDHRRHLPVRLPHAHGAVGRDGVVGVAVWLAHVRAGWPA